MILIRTENAIIERLRQGLGQLVREVGSYGGELDESLPDAIRRFPAAWVTFGGISQTVAHGTSRQKFRATGQFVVMVADRSVRGEAAGRHGGAGQGEVGSYPLVYAVRRLLSGQDLGLPIDALLPGRVRSLSGVQTSAQALSVFACDFQTAWIEDALPRGHWPSPQHPAEPDRIFAQYAGRLEQPAPDWLRTGLDYHLTPDDGVADARDLISTRSEA